VTVTVNLRASIKVNRYRHIKDAAEQAHMSTYGLVTTRQREIYTSGPPRQQQQQQQHAPLPG